MAMFEDYAPYYMREGEEFNPYLARLRSERKGGILGGLGSWNTSGSDSGEASMADEALGMLIKKRFADVSGASDSGSSGDGGYVAPRRELSLEEMVRQKTDQDFDPFYLTQLLPGPLSGIAGGMLALDRNSKIEAKLKELGYSQDDIDFMMDNKQYLMSELVSNPQAGFGKEVDYEALRGLRGQSLFDSLLSDGDSVPYPKGSALDAFAYGRVDPRSNVMSYDPSTQSGTAMVNGALSNVYYGGMFNPAHAYGRQNLAQQYQLYGQGKEMSTVNPKAVASAQAAVERERAAAEAARQAEAARVAAATSAGDRSIYDRNVSAYTSDSSGGSTTGYVSSGGTQTVGTGGGNASRGFSYGGW